MPERKIVVIGSSNTDMVINTSKFPGPGETVLGGKFFMNTGGKGANQALAAKRLGGEVAFIGKIGNDIFGRKAIDFLKNEGVLVDDVFIDPDNHSGIAMIIVNRDGENSIIVADSSNNTLSSSDILKVTNIIDSSEIILLQLEIPIETVAFISEYAKKANKKIILNPAPVTDIPAELFKNITFITPNENEAEQLTGLKINNEKTALKSALALKEKGVENVIITLGPAGAFLLSEDYTGMISAPKVKAIDSTAAGDTFSGALAVAVSKGYRIENAVKFANFAAALSVTRFGAQNSIPFEKEVLEFLKRKRASRL
jgi:ribokinase